MRVNRKNRCRGRSKWPTCMCTKHVEWRAQDKLEAEQRAAKLVPQMWMYRTRPARPHIAARRVEFIMKNIRRHVEALLAAPTPKWEFKTLTGVVSQ